MNDVNRFSLYPIGRIARGSLLNGADDEDFDLALLPFEIFESINVEDVSALVRKGEFDIHKPGLGQYRIHELEKIKYAIIHRYPQHGPSPDTGEFLVDGAQRDRSRRLVLEIAACLRIIRPITTRAQFCEGEIADSGELHNIAFDEPIPDFSLPTNQRQFALRSCDAEDLRFYTPLFIAAMAGPFWKFRMAVQMYDAGFFQVGHWKLRFFLWTSALEALFTSQNANGEHRGSRVAKERIKEHLGANSSLYPKGELTSLIINPDLKVADVVDEIYCLRNHIAHGDAVPDYYFEATGRPDYDGNLIRIEMLSEAISVLLRQSLLRIMKDNLLRHFQNSVSSEEYFAALGLNKTSINARLGRRSYTCPS
jgi:hypothetical protein